MLQKVNVLKTNDELFRQTKDLPQIFAIFSGSISGIAGGTLFAFASPAIPKLLSEYKFNLEEVSYITVIPPLAMILTAGIFCLLTDKIGRKRTLLSTGILHILAWIFTAVAQNIYVFYVSRVFYGMGDACLFASLPVYIAEVSTPKVRGLYGNVMLISIFIGQFLANVIGYYFSIQTTALIMLCFPILFLITFAFMPETPYYLIMKGDTEGARKSLQKLRGCEDVKDELKQLTLDVQRQLSESGGFKDLWLIPSNRRALMIANLSRCFQQFSGFGALIVYSQYIFQEAGGNLSSGASAMIISGCLAFVNLFANIINDKLGRKKSMTISSFCCGLVLLAEASYFYLQGNRIVDVSMISWFPVVGVLVYTTTFCIGLGVVPTLMLGELFSASIRQHAVTVSNITFGVYICVVTKLFQVMMASGGMWLPFFVFSLCCFVGSVFSYFIVPETKGKTLEQIQQMLKGSKDI